MSKAVLISIRPKWCELIASGKKTIEVRKTRPKIETPFKCYMYMSKYHWAFDLLRKYGMEDLADRLMQETGMVIGEFMCDKVYKFSTRVYLGEEQEISDDEIVAKSCLSRSELRNYEGHKTGLLGWHISDLEIYEEPKPLSDFHSCSFCDYRGVCPDGSWCQPLKRPPQSWCYVEEVNS